MSFTTLTNYLEAFVRLTAMTGHPTVEAVVLEHGRHYEVKSKPADVEFGVAKACFANAGSAALCGRYRYAEGYACSPSGIPVHHAWLVDGEDGKAIEVTWRDDGVCGFCSGNGVVNKAVEWDDDGDEVGWDEVPCAWCSGSGEDPYYSEPHSPAEYFGIDFDTKEYSRLVFKAHVYDILATWAQELKEKAA